MTVPVQVPYNSYTYAGSATFVYGFKILQATDLQVSVDGVIQPAANYTVSGVGAQTGGSILYTGTLTTGQLVELQRITVLARANDYQNEGDFLADTVNADYDRLWMALQEQDGSQVQALRVPEIGGIGTLPAAAARALCFLAFDAYGNATITPIVTAPTTSSVGVSVDSAGAVGNGTADDTIPMNIALSAAAVLGGDVLLTAGRIYKITTSLVLPSHVRLRMNGATIAWAGGAAPVVTSSSTSILTESGIEGGVIDGGASATQVVLLRSPYHCRVRDVTLKSNSVTCVAFDVAVNVAGGTNADGNRNAVFNYVSNVLQDGVCGQGMRWTGDAAVPTVCTLNTVVNFNARGCSVYGINFTSWCDSNYFSGVTRLQLVANNAVGVVWNSGTPASNVGVYSNNFDHLAVDTFAGPTGRVGIQMNWTKLNKIDYYFNDPPAEGGAYSFSANCQSYDVTHQVGLTSNLIRRLKLEYFGGKDNPIVLFGGGSEITTETVGLEVGLGRTGNGFAYVDLIGDTTFTNYGLRAIRNGAGSSQLLHQGASQLEMKAQTAGGSVGLTTSTGSKVLCNDTGIGFLAATPVAQSTGWGTPTGNAKVASFPGATATLAQTSAQLAQLIIDLKAFGLLGA